MVRKLLLLAIALSLSALMAAPVHAAPIRTLGPKTTPEVDIFAEALKRLSTWIRGYAFSPPGKRKTVLPEDTSHIDPNGNH
jgi:hypothetical protein